MVDVAVTGVAAHDVSVSVVSSADVAAVVGVALSSRTLIRGVSHRASDRDKGRGARDGRDAASAASGMPPSLAGLACALVHADTIV